MPKKNKNAKNPFSFFMKELQQEMQIQGQFIPMSEMPKIAHPKWAMMMPEEKYKYEIMAKEYKENKRGRMEGKYTCDGFLIDELMKEEEEEQRKEQKMLRHIKMVIEQMGSPQDVADELLYISCSNILCMTNENVYIPLEIGIVEYSIRRGIIRRFHKFINPGTIPTGYTGKAKEHSEQYHQIPIFNFNQGDENYLGTYLQIKKFVNPDELDPCPPLFCPSDQLSQTKGCLKWLHEQAYERGHQTLACWDLTVLLLELRLKVNQPIPKVVAEDYLTKTTFDYIPKTRCEFHEELDSPHCALGRAQRLCFMLSDAICKYYDVEPTLNHLPPREFESQNFTRMIPKLPEPKPMINKINVPVKPVTEHQFKTVVSNVKSKFVEDDNMHIVNSVAVNPRPLDRGALGAVGGPKEFVTVATPQYVTPPAVDNPNEFPALGMSKLNLDKSSSATGKQYASVAGRGRLLAANFMQPQTSTKPPDSLRQPKTIPQALSAGIGRGKPLKSE
ncbi:protein maelstrom homolog [Limulus polyphemus]|uniref:Protein maelstrom homolog n=1 Tax=Limulus polyphemus TaxID=6850 RepID=A0ABM1BRR4_LIMPO|nr:protein maelstrom homolog [Limulus polyphemus]